jgi:hypothetical protein
MLKLSNSWQNRNCRPTKKGGYSRAKINTFASIFPTSSPKYVFIVMLDTPKTSSSYIYNYRHKEGTQTGHLIIQLDGHQLK